MSFTIEEKKTDLPKSNLPTEPKQAQNVEKEPTLEALFLTELGRKLKGFNAGKGVAYEQIKKIRKEIVLLEDYENFAIENVDTYADLIPHIIHNKIRFEDNGVVVKLRSPLSNSHGKVVAEEVKVLYVTDRDLERKYTQMKLDEKDVNTSLDYANALTRAAVRVKSDNKIMPLSEDTFNRITKRDMTIISNVYAFFR